MKRLVLISVMIGLLSMLSGCGQKPYEGPEGTVFVESDELVFRIWDYDTESYYDAYSFDFIEEMKYFDVISIEGFEFTQINNYLEASYEFKRFVNKAAYSYIDEYEADYGSEIELSKGASENNANSVDIAIESAKDLDAYIITEEGYSIVFYYTEVVSDGEIIVIPSAMYFFVFEIYSFSSCGVVDGEYVFEDFEARNVPLMAKSSPNVVYNGTEHGNFAKLLDSGDMDCSENNTTLSGTIHETFSKEDVYDFYEERYQGVMAGDLMIFTFNEEDYTIEITSGDTIEFEIKLLQ